MSADVESSGSTASVPGAPPRLVAAEHGRPGGPTADVALAGSGGRWLAAILVAGTLILGLLYLQRPAGQFYYPRCSLHAATGLLCPGCGGLRATHELLHGRVLAALRSNALLVGGIPAAAGWIWYQRRRGRSPWILSARAACWIVGVVGVYGVLRNIPRWPLTLLAP